ncbi:16S rRNA (guanine(527)-N(7))-methyltransferase RsmG [Haloechinothrix sp. YIM 98757]|uniref:Ribosomal RNA small subunit methyltransferase G n=1 Tax=Haloechinothrix aidingensis TaxID=2752311 RepID=A0A838A6Y5_9PSEU|nr:16S rRNA (guanine(527)-N(7))-methyltransferase RsmG [Haloechinothrix aidingensis]
MRTVREAPEVATTILGPGVDGASRFVELLAEHGVARGLIGPREVERLWDRHVLNSAVVAELVEHGSTVVDVGSGAGLPGIPLALARPDLRVVLVESMARRVQWLEEVAAALGLGNVEIVRARAEACGVGGADVVIARAVAPMAKLGGWCLPLLRLEGRLLAMKGASAAEEVERDRAELYRLGGGEPAIVACGSGLLDDPATVVVVPKVSTPSSSKKRTSARSRSTRRGRAS